MSDGGLLVVQRHHQPLHGEERVRQTELRRNVSGCLVWRRLVQPRRSRRQERFVNVGRDHQASMGRLHLQVATLLQLWRERNELLHRGQARRWRSHWPRVRIFYYCTQSL